MILHLDLEANEYDIKIESGSLNDAGSFFDLDRKVLAVTDDGVPEDYVRTLMRHCRRGFVFSFPSGEKSKNFETLQAVLSELIKNNFTRYDAVVAVGGGVVSDLAGLAAALYMRGIDFYNIPTTLLAQADASVGGKCAVDLNGIKNIAGVFYQPKAVLIDPDTLKTLPERHISNGMAEIIKAALIRNAGLVEMIENTAVLDDPCEMITEAVKTKKEIVEQDEKEKGIRKILNFGHTIGHALETVSEGKLLHGECVAVGMMYMSGPDVRKRLKGLLESYDLPASCSFNREALSDVIAHDKKCRMDFIDCIEVEKLGECHVKRMTLEELGALMDSYESP